MGNNILVPYSGFISGGIHDGTEVVITGRTNYDFRRFSVNLCTGPNLNSDCLFHFNPRFDEGKVVRNHKQGGAWGLEDINGGMPFRRGHTFDLHIKVDHQGYKVTVNNQHFCHFHHRLPKESAQYIYIEGDVVITFIQFREHHGHHGHHGHHHGHHVPVPSYPPAPSYPAGPFIRPDTPGYPAFPPAPGYPTPGSGPIYNPPVPFTTHIPGGMYPGKIIYISGVPGYSPSRFTINLACGAFDSSDYALTFDARFNFGNDRNIVIRTHKQGGSYGPEERHQNYFPFSPGANFEVMILAEHNCFKIAVNNQHFTEFHHRIHPLQRVDHVNVVGDVQLTQVRFQ